MARVVDYYTAVMTNSGRIYDRPDTSGDFTSYDYGTELRLPADYGSRETNGFYPVTYPENGWINYQYVSERTAVYKTVTDKCTAPTSITLSGTTLTIKGGAGGDLNTFQGYQVSWRDATIGTTSYGSWSSDVTVSTSNTTATYAVSAPAGETRQFRARTIGSAGSSYYSDYVTCGTTLTGNTAPTAPTIVFPQGGAISMNPTPYVAVSCTADKDGDTLSLYRKIDSNAWSKITSVKSGTIYDLLPKLSAGTHTVTYYVKDPYTDSATVSVTFTIQEKTWRRSIAAGDIISNKSISHVSDIIEMMGVLNDQRPWFGLKEVYLPGVVGQFATWKPQMETILSGINECRRKCGQTEYSLAVPAYPTASVINALRGWLTGSTEGGSTASTTAALDEGRLDYMILE